jgi:hypothetical protein
VVVVVIVLMIVVTVAVMMFGWWRIVVVVVTVRAACESKSHDGDSEGCSNGLAKLPKGLDAKWNSEIWRNLSRIFMPQRRHLEGLRDVGGEA